MAQVINTNSLSLITQNNINKNQSALSSSMERLSSGLRINSAKDDAAGQAIANRFTSNIKGLTQAARNANDGISAAQTTEGALSEINNNLQRIRELTVQSQNGTNSDSDQASIQDEIKSRLDEIDRVSGQTTFNGVNVLAKDGQMSIQVGANDGETITVDLKKIDSSTLNLSGFSVKNNDAVKTSAAITTVGGTNTNNDIDFSATTLSTAAKEDASGSNPASIEGVYKATSGDYFAKVENGDNPGYYAVTVATDGKVTMDASATKETSDPAGLTKETTITSGTGKTVAIGTDTATTSLGAVSLVKLQDANGKDTSTYALKDAAGKLYAADVNETTGAVKAKTVASYTDADGKVVADSVIKLGGDDGKSEVVTDKASGKTYNASELEGANLSSKDNTVEAVADGKTTDPLKALDAAIASVDKFRSSLGAVQNRLASAITNLNNTTTNLTSAQSRIQDADYATEVSNMSKAQIVQQAGNSVLAKANQVPQQVLSLLQG